MSETRVRHRDNYFPLAIAAGVLYVFLRTRTLDPVGVVVLTLLAMGAAFLFLAIIVFREAERNARYLPYMLGLILMGGTATAGASASLLLRGLAVIVLLALLFLLAASTLRVRWWVPLIALALALFFPPILWPQALGLSYLAVVLLLNTALVFVFSLLAEWPAVAATERLFIYLCWMIFAVYAILAQVPVSDGLMTWAIWGILAVGVSVLAGAATMLEKGYFSWPLFAPTWYCWQQRHYLRDFLDAPPARQGERLAALAKIETGGEEDPLLLLGDQIRYSLRFHQALDELLDEFARTLLAPRSPAAYLGQQAFLDLPAAKVNESLRFYLQSEVWYGRLKQLRPPAANDGWQQLVEGAWPAYSKALSMKIRQMVRKKELAKHLNLPPGQSIQIPFSSEGILLDYRPGMTKSLRRSWIALLRSELSPASLMPDNQEAARQVADLLSWLGEVRTMRDRLLALIENHQGSKGWHQGRTLARFGQRGQSLTLTVMRRLHDNGIYFEAADLGRMALDLFFERRPQPEWGHEIALSEFDYFAGQGWSQSADLKAGRAGVVRVDGRYMHLVNQTLSHRMTAGVPVQVLVKGPVVERFSLGATQGRYLPTGQYDVIVCPTDPRMTPLHFSWQAAEAPPALAMELIAPPLTRLAGGTSAGNFPAGPPARVRR